MAPPALLAALLAAGTAVRYGAPLPLEPTPLEARAIAAVRARLGPAVALSPELSRAARLLTDRALDGKRNDSGIRQALAETGCPDPAPSFLLVSDVRESLPARLAAALPRGTFSHFGIGIAERGAAARAVLLASRRELQLAPFPRDIAPGATAELRGELLGPLRAPRIFLTDPTGSPRSAPSSGDRRFVARLTFDRPGRWVVEVLADGAGGPRIVGLLPISVGGASLAAPPRPDAPEPVDVAQAEAEVLVAVNRLRSARGLPPVTASAALTAAARRHSAAMLEAHEVAHVLPGGQDAGGRLRAARIPFRKVLENLARGSTSLAAHASLEESPAHLANLIAPEVERAGIGVARRLGGDNPAVYLTELFVQPVDDSSDSRLRPESRVREVLWRERDRRGKPALLSDPLLDELAGRAARAMLRADNPALSGFDDEALRLGRKIAAIDALVTSSPGQVSQSNNVGDKRLRRVGVGVAIGDSVSYGAGLLWIAVIYTD